MAEGDGPEEFTVRVEGALDPDGVWNIHAHLRFRNGILPEPGSALFAEGTREMMEGIAREGARGRAAGAASCRLHLDAPGERTTLELGDRFPDPIALDD